MQNATLVQKDYIELVLSDLLTISLCDLRFFSYHGLYSLERKTGNSFEVNCFVSYEAPTEPITELKDTIDYAAIYQVVKTSMDEPRDLLETLAMEIVEKLQRAYPQVKRIEISIAKLHPPIIGFDGKVGISLIRNFA